MINYLALFAALVLSTIAAYYAVAGLAAIFAAAMIPIIIMGGALEFAKVVAASWVYRNWDTAPKLLRYYLLVSVVILMFITSLGTFGFLSKAHLDQNLVGADTNIELKVIDQQIQNEQRRLDNAQRSIIALDRLVDNATPETANQIRNQQTRERTRLLAEINTSAGNLKALNTQAAPLRKDSARIAAEVGPIKYIADLIYGEEAEGVLEKAVRFVIILIVVVFDPLAVVLLIAANHGLKNSKRDPVIDDFIQHESQKRSRKGKSVNKQDDDVKNDKDGWHPKLYTLPNWVKRAKKLKEKRDPSKIEIDKDKIARM
jgi:hypothetical protein